MADLNALIAQGAQFQAPVDPFAQYGKMQQLQNAGMQNQLAQYQFEAAKRADLQANALNQAYGNAVNPDTGEIDYAQVRKSLATGGAGSQIPALEKTRMEQEKAALERQKLTGEIAAQSPALALKKLEVLNSQFDQSKKLLNQIDPNSPDAGSQLMAWHQSNHAPGLLGDTLRANGSTPEQTIGNIQAAIAQGPKGIANFIQRSTLGQTEFAAKIAPTPKEVTDGQKKFFVDSNPQSPTFGMKVGGEGFQTQATPGENLTANTAAKRLAFEQGKFAWEKANPGKTIKEITQADGSTQVVAIDNRTGTATQVMMAGVPGAAPAGGGRGAVGVTDGRVGPATPLVGAKPSNAQATEGERKAATLLQRLQFSQSQLTQALEDNPNASKPGVFASAVAKLSTPLANTLTPETRQRVESAQLDMLDAALTLGTGAAYTKEQLEGYRQSYFPQIGDGPKQILDKQARLNNVIAAAKIASGRAEKLVPTPPLTTGASDVRSAADKIIGGK
jgi:hypothetical protein